MPVEIRVPPLGESVVEATVGQWKHKEGDTVARDEELVELETDKVAMTVTSYAAGKLAQILKREGETVAPGDVLGLVALEHEVASEATGAPPTPQAQFAGHDYGGEYGDEERGPSKRPAVEPIEARRSEEVARTQHVGERLQSDIKLSPAVRRLAVQHRIDLSAVKGTGRGDRITKADVLEFMKRQEAAPAAPPPPTAAPPQPQPQPAPPQPAHGPEERVPMSRRRRLIAERLVQAQREAAYVTTFNEIDMSAVVALRDRLKDAFQQKHGAKLTYMPFFVRASVGALRAFPNLNSEVQGDTIVVKRYYNIGIAVDTEEGLLVPVLRGADRKSMVELSREIADAAARARDGRLRPDELMGGTFTITNGGVFGSLLSTPVPTPPQTAILGLHRIEQRPVAVDGSVEVRPMMYAALTYDHRVVDGREAVLFLAHIKELVEDPEALLLEG